MQRDVFLIVSAVSAVIDIWLGLLQLQVAGLLLFRYFGFGVDGGVMRR